MVNDGVGPHFIRAVQTLDKYFFNVIRDDF
jgi:hypothetical protein